MNKKNIIVFILILAGAILILGGARNGCHVAEKNGDAAVETASMAAGVDQEIAGWLIHEGRLKLRLGRQDSASLAACLAELFDPGVKRDSLERDINETRTRLVERFRSEADEARLAGDLGRFERAAVLMRRATGSETEQ